MSLSTRQKQHLKGLAHPLKPIVLLDNNDLAEGVLTEIEQALEHHELIEVRAATENRETRTLIMEAIMRETGARSVQVISKTLVLYCPVKECRTSLPRQDYPKVTHTCCVERGVSRKQENKMPRSVR